MRWVLPDHEDLLDVLQLVVILALVANRVSVVHLAHQETKAKRVIKEQMACLVGRVVMVSLVIRAVMVPRAIMEIAVHWAQEAYRVHRVKLVRLVRTVMMVLQVVPVVAVSLVKLVIVVNQVISV